ncbi:hypothetical protein LTR49_027500, partial [Elasticomyces elasticus]
YLLAGVGATIEDTMLPAVTMKRKIVAKKSTAKEEVVDEEGAKTPDGQTPRNAATSTKPKASTRKRKASTLPTPKPSDSPEGVGSNPTEQGSDVTPPKAEKAKATPRKRKAEARATPDETVENAPPRKRIRAGTNISSSSGKTDPPGKGVPPRPAPAPLTPILAAKVRQVQDKVLGHGLDDVNLLEIELEIQSQQAQASLAQHQAAIKMLSSPEDMQAFFDKTLAGVTHSEKQRALETQREQAYAALQAAAGPQETRHMGVCPQPPIPVI